jgi:hypothetical protein
MSAATNGTSLCRNVNRKAALGESLSSSAMTSVAPVALQWARANAANLARIRRTSGKVVTNVLSAGPVASVSPPNPVRTARAFPERLRDLGWIEGRNLIIERRSAEVRPEGAPVIVAELVSAGCEVIWVGKTDWLTR